MTNIKTYPERYEKMINEKNYEIKFIHITDIVVDADAEIIDDEIVEIIDNAVQSTKKLNFISVFEDKIDEIDEINNDNIKIIDEIEDVILKLYLFLKYNDFKAIKIYKKYSFISEYINIFDLKYFLKYKINNLKEKKFKKLYNYNNIIKNFKEYYNISDEDLINDLNQYFNIVYDETDNKVYYKNDCYYLHKYSYEKNVDDLIKEIYKNQMQYHHQDNKYYIISFDDINVTSLNFLCNLYNSISNNVFDDEIEFYEDNKYNDFNMDLIEDKFDLNLYYSLYDNNNNLLFNPDDVYDEIYDKLFNNIIYDFNNDIEINDVIYKYKTLFISKDYIKRVNPKIDKYYDKIYYYDCYKEKYIINKDNLFEILLKSVNTDIYNYYELIEIISDTVTNNNILCLDDFNKSRYLKNISYTDLYFYIKYHYNLNLKKDDLIYI